VSWDQFHSCGDTDLDAYLRHADGTVLGRSEDAQDADGDRCTPLERLYGYVEQDGWYHLEVMWKAGASSNVNVNVLVSDGSVYANLPEGSVTDPSTHPSVLSVGAVRADENYANNDVESFSSRGPTSDGRPKPDIAGPDGLTVEAYGPVGFYGTSAAAPSVAGALVLVLSEDPTLTPPEGALRLQQWAIGDDPLFETPDPRWGWGRARLPDPDARDEPQPCGHRRMLLPLWLLPFGLLRRRWRSAA
jgi:subtilisin family serine protease